MLLLQGDTEAAKAFVGNDAEILNNTLYRIKRAIANNPIDAATPLNHIGSEAFLRYISYLFRFPVLSDPLISSW